MVKRIILLVVLLFTASISFSANYKAILKATGKVIEGTYIRETDTIIYLQVEGGIQIQLKKDQLDLDKMKELNGEIQQAENKKTVNTFKHETKTITRNFTGEDKRSFVEVSKDTAKHRTGTAKSFKEGDHPCSKIAWSGESGLKKLIEDIEYEIADKEFRGNGSEEELNELKAILALAKQEDAKGAWAGEAPSKEVSIIFLKLLVAEDKWRLAVAQNYGEQEDIDDARDTLKEDQDALLTLQSEVASLNSGQQPCPEEKKETVHTTSDKKNPSTATGKLDRAASEAKLKRKVAKVYTEADIREYDDVPEEWMGWWMKLSKNDREMWIRKSEDDIQVQENLVARYQSESAPEILIQKEVKKLEGYKAELRRMVEHLDAPYEPYEPPEPPE